MKGNHVFIVKSVEFIEMSGTGERLSHTKVTGLRIKAEYEKLERVALSCIKIGRKKGLHVVKTTCGKWFYL